MIETYRPRRFVWFGAVGCALVVLFAAIIPVAEAWDGELDTDFTGTGIMAFVMGSDDGEGRGVAVRRDGTYVLVGVTENADDDFGVNSFGRGLVIQPDGKIVVVGISDSATFAVARLDTAGALDPDFGIGGIYDDGTFVPLGDRDAWDVDLLPNGWIVVVGHNHINALPPHIPGGDYFCVQVMESDGSRLSHADIDFGGHSEARGVVGVAEIAVCRRGLVKCGPIVHR